MDKTLCWLTPQETMKEYNFTIQKVLLEAKIIKGKYKTNYACSTGNMILLKCTKEYNLMVWELKINTTLQCKKATLSRENISQTCLY